MENYPAISILVKHGKILAVLVALLPLLGALCLVFSVGMHWSVLVAGLIAGALAGFLVKVMVELTVIITDMLLPK